MADGIKKISENVIRPGRALTLVSNSVTDYDGIPAGTIKTTRENQGIQYKISDNNWSKFHGEGALIFGSVTTNLLANNSVTNPKIADSAVDTRTIKDSNVTTVKIANLNVTTEKLANLCVTTGKIANLNVTEPKIATDAVITRCIKNLNVTTDKIASRAIIGTKIAADAITNFHVADNAIQTENLLNKCVTFNKIADGQVYGAKIPNNGIDHMHINSNAITYAKIAPGAVTGAADKGVGGGKIAKSTITSDNISPNSISGASIAKLTITGGNSGHIASSTITNYNIASKTIDKSKLTEAVQNVLDLAVCHDVNGNAKVKKTLAIGTNPKAGYALSVDGNMIANRVYNAVYMDLAEGYVPGEDLEPGDIVAMENDGKVYKANMFSKCVVGVVSDQYATCLGATPEELANKTKVAVGLIGKVPVKVKGYACLGQYICLSDEPGVGYATTDKKHVVGKVLENMPIESASDDNKISKVLCLIYPN